MYYRQPRYFSNFVCVGGSCKNSCCIGWQIDWTNEEVDKLKNAPNISAELMELVEDSFHPNETSSSQMIVKLGVNGRCPFLTEDNFCKIQRELGAEYLSNTCMVYPRLYIFANDIDYRFYHMSCPVVMDKLLNDEKSMDLVNAQIRESYTQKNVITNTLDLLAAHPEFEYRGELLEFFYEIIADNRHDIETSIILGALAAQQISKLIEKKQYDRIPEAIKEIKSQLNNAAQIKSIENIRPNYKVKLGIAGKFLDQINPFKVIKGLIDETGALNIDLYNMGEASLAENFSDRPFYMRNIALNMLLELALPFKFTEHTVLENYSVFAISFALIKLNTIATMEIYNRADRKEGSDINDIIIKSAAMVSRNLCHSSPKSEALIGVLNRNNMLTPAYLAVFIK